MFAYPEIGTIETIGAFYAWFIVINDYVVKPRTLWLIGTELGTAPKVGDVYNPMAGPCLGNSNCNEGNKMRVINQLAFSDGWIDLRLFFHQFDPTDFGKCILNDPSKYSKWFYVSWFKGPNNSDVSLCYSTESWKIAQTAYFIATVQMQWANILICKT